jgi:hypothetical protein
MESDDACNQVFQGIEADKWMIIPSINAKTVILFARLFPRLFAASIKQFIRYAVNKIDSKKKV